MQRVDPFIPVPPHHNHVPLVRPANVPAQPAKPPKRPVGPVDGFVRPQPTHPPPVPVTQPTASVAPANPVPVAPTHPLKPKRRRLRDKLKVAGLMLVILSAGTAVQTLFVGEVLIVVYAVYAWARHIPSRTTFLLALVAVVVIVVLHAMGRDAVLATNFAVYALLLIFVGVVTLAREVRQSKV